MSRFVNVEGGHGDVDVDFLGGHDDAEERAGFVEYGPLDVREKMRDAHAVMRAADEEITSAKGVPKDFLKKWTLLWVGWNRFRDRFNLPPGFVAQFRDTTYKRADLYIRTAQAFLDGLHDKTWLAAKIQPAPPPTVKNVPVAPGEQRRGKDGKPGKAASGGWEWWKWLALGGVVAGGGYLAWRLWPKKRGGGELAGGDAAMIEAPHQLVTNPPVWVQDPDVWESAKLATEPYRQRYDNPEAVTTHVYKQMGGRVG